MTWAPAAPRAAPVLEAIYRIDLPLDEWLAGIVAETSASANGAIHAAHAFEVGPGLDVRIRAIVGDAPEINRGFRDAVPDLDPAVFARTALSGKRAFSLRGIYKTKVPPALRAFLRQFSMRDTWQANGTSSDRGGAILAFGLPAIAQLPRGIEASWGRIGSHLAAAHRLRDRLERGGPLPSACILTPGGRVVHAEGPGQAASEREVLRDAARAIDRARTRAYRNDPEHVLAAWRALVGGRWSLLDAFESDGRRLMVAKVNEPAALDRPAADALPLRARQVAMRLARGEANKVIAYELGVSASTVAWHVRKLAERIGVRTRVELVQRLAARG
jgi:DNA-binding CsgD family transcriptional regulator